MYRIRFTSNAKSTFFVVLAMLLFVVSTNAQSLNSEQWTFHSEQSGVKVYYKISKCFNESTPTNSITLDPTLIGTSNFQSVVLLKFENLENVSKKLSWNSFIETTNTELNRATLLASGLKETTCDDSPKFELRFDANSSKPKSMAEVISGLTISIVTN